MPITKKAKSALPKGARTLKSSTPKRPATSSPTSPSETENTKRTKTHLSPKFAPPSSKSRPSSSKPLKDCAPKPTTSTKTLASKTSTVLKSKSTISATTTKQKAPLYSTVGDIEFCLCPTPASSSSGHSFQAPSHKAPVISNPNPAPRSSRPIPIPAPRLSLSAPASTRQPTQDTRTNSLYINFDLKYWKSETEVLIALNSEYPFLTYNIKGKVGQSVSITVDNVENFTVFASLKQLNNKSISFVPKQPFTPSIQAVISNVPATVSARTFLSINNIVSAERMFSFSQSLKSKVPTSR